MNELEARQLRSYQQYAPSIGYGQKSFPDLVNSMLEVVQTHPNDKVVLVFTGRPTSGKSKGKKLTTLYLGELMGQNNIDQITYEEDGEDAARLAGDIETEERYPFKEEELAAADLFLEKNTAHKIQTGSEQFILAEIPAVTYVEMATQSFGRRLGSKTFENLTGHQGLFAEIDTNYHVFATGIVPGYWPRILAFYREEINACADYKDAQKIARLFGQPPPLTHESWLEQKKSGASIKAIQEVSSQIDEMHQMLSNDGIIPVPPSQLMNLSTPQELIGILPQSVRVHEFSRWWKDGHTIEHIFGRLRIPSERAFIAYNNPHAGHLSIPNVKELLDFIQVKGYQRFI